MLDDKKGWLCRCSEQQGLVKQSAVAYLKEAYCPAIFLNNRQKPHELQSVHVMWHSGFKPGLSNTKLRNLWLHQTARSTPSPLESSELQHFKSTFLTLGTMNMSHFSMPQFAHGGDGLRVYHSNCPERPTRWVLRFRFRRGAKDPLYETSNYIKCAEVFKENSNITGQLQTKFSVIARCYTKVSLQWNSKRSIYKVTNMLLRLSAAH
jgi:hypothetical protein